MRRIRATLLALGTVSSLVQFSLIRELLGAYGGNEYLVGLSLGCWLLFAGTGSLCARGRAARVAARWQAALLVVLGFFSMLSVAGLRWARYHVFIAGGTLGPAEQLLATALAELPYCLLSGFLLAANARLLAAAVGEHGVGASYQLDSLGAILGGLIFAFGLSWWLGHLQIAGVCAALLALTALYRLAGNGRARAVSATALAVMALLAILLSCFYERPTLEWLVPSGRLVFEARSVYGQIVVSDLDGQRTYFRNGAPLFTTDVPETVEQLVHVPLLAHRAPRRIAVLGPPLRDIAAELAKHTPEEVVFIDQDPVLERALRACGDADSRPPCRVVVGDPRSFLATCERPFDLVIVTEQSPSTLLANRYFSREFAHIAARSLAPGGIVALQLGPFPQYVAPAQARLISSVTGAFRAEFASVRLIPTDTVFLLASNAPITADLGAELTRRRIDTLYVRASYLAAMLDREREETLERAVAVAAPANRDLKPIASRLALQRWFSEFGLTFGAGEAVLLALGAWVLLRLRRAEWSVFTAGFASAGLEYVALLSVQTVLGSLYYLTTLLVTAFMVGLVAGAHWGNVVPATPRRIAAWLGAFAALAAVEALVTTAMSWSVFLPSARLAAVVFHGAPAAALFGLLLAAVGAATGAVFSLCARAAQPAGDARAARVYAADFVGGSLGAVLFATLLVPAAGLVPASLATALLLAAVAGLIAWPAAVPRR